MWKQICVLLKFSEHKMNEMSNTYARAGQSLVNSHADWQKWSYNRRETDKHRRVFFCAINLWLIALAKASIYFSF